MRHPKKLEDIKGQSVAKRALEIALVGDHDVMLVGPLGAGKTPLPDGLTPYGSARPSITPHLSLLKAGAFRHRSGLSLARGAPLRPPLTLYAFVLS